MSGNILNSNNIYIFPHCAHINIFTYYFVTFCVCILHNIFIFFQIWMYNIIDPLAYELSIPYRRYKGNKYTTSKYGIKTLLNQISIKHIFPHLTINYYQWYIAAPNEKLFIFPFMPVLLLRIHFHWMPNFYLSLRNKMMCHFYSENILHCFLI